MGLPPSRAPAPGRQDRFLAPTTGAKRTVPGSVLHFCSNLAGESVPDETIRAYGHRASASGQVFMTDDDVSDERTSARAAARATAD